ncbi:MAG TPA: hypothetical protein VFB34_02585 [Chloroflexota bacterium]|nr:hypothetical protein [Chloroflexota bacterium]
MNVYEQLVAVRDELRHRGAKPGTISAMDGLIGKAEPEKENPMSVSQLMVLRHVMRSPAVLNDEDVYLDVLALQGDLEEAAGARAEPEAAYVDDSRRPKLHSFYKKQRAN